MQTVGQSKEKLTCFCQISYKAYKIKKTYQPNAMYGSCFDPDSNKQTVKKKFFLIGKILNLAWIFDDIKEWLLNF